MLTTIRDKAGGWFAYALVILFVIPFAFFGIQDYFSGSGPQVVAIVNGTEIPVQAYNRELQMQQREIASQYGGKLPNDEAIDALVKERVIEGMVRRELLRTEIEKAGYASSDQAVFNRLSSISAFQSNGRFDADLYTNVLASQRRQKSEFEASLREDIRLAQFLNGLQTSVFLPVENQVQYESLLNQRRTFNYFVYQPDVPQFAEKITAANIEEHYRSAINRYQSPERMRVQYVEVKESDLMSFIEVKEEALREIYNQAPPEILTPERREAAHILLKWDESTSEEDKQASRKLANEIVDQARANQDFAELAAKYSEDKLSSASGGSLGEVQRGDLAPEIETVLFQLEASAISRPVETLAGLEILRVNKVHPAVQKPYEDVRDSLEENYRQRQTESIYVDQSESLLTSSYEHPDNLEIAADAIGAEVKSTGWFTRDQGEGIAASAQVRDAAFSEAVKGGQNSDLIDISPGHVLVLRVSEHEPAKPKPLENVTEEIRMELARQQAELVAKEKVDGWLAMLRSGESIEDTAEQENQKLVMAEAVTRSDQSFPPTLLKAVFSTPKPADSRVNVGMQTLENGEYAIFALREVVNAQPSDVSEKATESLSVDYAERELEAILGALRQKADVEIIKENL